MAEHFVLTCNPVWPTQAYVKLAIVKEAGHVLLFFFCFFFLNYDYLVQVDRQFLERCV